MKWRFHRGVLKVLQKQKKPFLVRNHGLIKKQAHWLKKQRRTVLYEVTKEMLWWNGKKNVFVRVPYENHGSSWKFSSKQTTIYYQSAVRTTKNTGTIFKKLTKQKYNRFLLKTIVFDENHGFSLSTLNKKTRKWTLTKNCFKWHVSNVKGLKEKLWRSVANILPKKKKNILKVL